MQNNITKLALLFGIIATIGFGINSAQAAEISGGLGHMTLVLKDSEGDIKQYVQTDNVITTEGLDCLIQQIFGDAPADTTCDDTSAFDTIAIGEGSDQTVSATGLGTIMGSGCNAASPAVGIAPVANSATSPQKVTITAIFGGGTAGSGDIDDAVCTGTITEAGLFNVGSATVAPTNIFAYQFFTGIVLATADTLTVTWDIDFS